MQRPSCARGWRHDDTSENVRVGGAVRAPDTEAQKQAKLELAAYVVTHCPEHRRAAVEGYQVAQKAIGDIVRRIQAPFAAHSEVLIGHLYKPAEPAISLAYEFEVSWEERPSPHDSAMDLREQVCEHVVMVDVPNSVYVEVTRVVRVCDKRHYEGERAHYCAASAVKPRYYTAVCVLVSSPVTSQRCVVIRDEP